MDPPPHTPEVDGHGAGSRRLLVAAVALYLLSRGLFLLHAPDWGPVHYEHCFFLSAPEVHAALESELGHAVDYSLSEPARFRTHYFRGLRWLAQGVRAATALWGNETIRAVRFIGLLLGGLFFALFAWMLLRLWPRDPWRAGLPLVACILAPHMFLHVSLTPMGAFTEMHVFYGLLIPFLLAAAQRGLRAWELAAVALISGIAASWAFAMLVLPATVLAAHLRFGTGPAWRRFGEAFAAGALTTGVWLGLSHRQVLFEKLFSGVRYAQTDVGAAATWLENLASLGSRELLLSGGYSRLGLLQVMGTEGVWALGGAAVLGVVLAAAVLRLGWALVRTRRESALGERVLWAHALLALSYFAGWVVFNSRTAREVYLAPLFPWLFVGAGVVASELWTSRRGRMVLALPAAAFAGVLVAGYGHSLAHNMRDPGRPAQARCDALTLRGLFVSGPQPGDGWEVDFAGGEARCRTFLGGEEALCALQRYGIEHWQSAHGDDYRPCADIGDPARARLCARAFGAVVESPRYCTGALPRVEDDALCARLPEALRAPCRGAAFQGLRYHTDSCAASLLALCDRALWGHDGQPGHESWRRFYACGEQISALLMGQPELPLPGGTLPASCRDWPGPWQALCARAEALATRPPRPEAPSCQVEYAARWADAVPPGRISYEHCLAIRRDDYPWCAIGLSRTEGLHDCDWAEDPTLWQRFASRR